MSRLDPKRQKTNPVIHVKKNPSPAASLNGTNVLRLTPNSNEYPFFSVLGFHVLMDIIVRVPSGLKHISVKLDTNLPWELLCFYFSFV